MLLSSLILFLTLTIQTTITEIPNADMKTYETQIIKSVLDQNVFHVDMVKIADDKLTWEHYADLQCIQVDILKYLYIVPDDLAAKAQKEIDDKVHLGTFGLRLSNAYLSKVNEQFAFFDVEYPANLVFFEGYFHNSTIDAVVDPAKFLDTPSDLIYEITALEELSALLITDDVIFAKEITLDGVPVDSGSGGAKSRSRSSMRNPASLHKQSTLGPNVDVFSGSVPSSQMNVVRNKSAPEPKQLEGVIKQNRRFYTFACQFVLKAYNFYEAYHKGTDEAKALSFYLLKKFVTKFDYRNTKKKLDFLFELIQVVQGKTGKELKAAIQAFVEDKKNLDMSTYGLLSDFYMQAKSYVEKNPNKLEDVFHDISAAAKILNSLYNILMVIVNYDIDHATPSEFARVEPHVRSVTPDFEEYQESVRSVSARVAPTIAETKVIDITLYTPRYDTNSGSAIDRITTATSTTGYTVNINVVNAFTDGLSAYNTVKTALFEAFAGGVINLPALTPDAAEEFSKIKKYLDNKILRKKYCSLAACNCGCICVDKTCEILPESAVCCPVTDSCYIQYQLNKLTDICYIINIVFGSGSKELYGQGAFMDQNTWGLVKNSSNSCVNYAVCLSLLEEYYKTNDVDFSFKESISPGFGMKPKYTTYVTRSAIKTTRSNNETAALRQVCGLTDIENTEMEATDKTDDVIVDDEDATSDEDEESEDDEDKKKTWKYILYGLLIFAVIIFIIVIIAMFAM